MMQQERERENHTEKQSHSSQAKQEGQQVYRYNKWLFWLTHLQSVGHFFALLAPIVWTIQSHHFELSWLAGLPFLLGQSWYSTRKLRVWITKHGNETILLDEEKIEWRENGNENKVVTMRWNEIAQAYKQDDVYVLIKTGVEEEEIRFYDTCYLAPRWEGMTTFAMFFGPSSGYLSGHIKGVEWEDKDKETLHVPSPRSAYQIAGAQVYSYHTKNNRFREVGWMIGAAYFSIFTLIPVYKDPLSLWSVAGFVYVSLALWHIFRVRSWYHHSQIEIDDLGIALVEPKGVTWRVPWFVVESYQSLEKQGVLTTKDGKEYKFRRVTARKEELDAEIWRRVEQNTRTQ
jgi:hypothetical protein